MGYFDCRAIGKFIEISRDHRLTRFLYRKPGPKDRAFAVFGAVFAGSCDDRRERTADRQCFFSLRTDRNSSLSVADSCALLLSICSQNPRAGREQSGVFNRFPIFYKKCMCSVNSPSLHFPIFPIPTNDTGDRSIQSKCREPSSPKRLWSWLSHRKGDTDEDKAAPLVQAMMGAGLAEKMLIHSTMTTSAKASSASCPT